MRFASYRYAHQKKWLCLCIVKRWRPIYARWNQLLSPGTGLVQWRILTEEEFDGVHRGRLGIENLGEDQAAL